MPTYIFRKRLGALRPADSLAEQALAELKPDESIRVEWKRVRNPRQHNLFFALLKMVYENQSIYESQEALRKAWLVHAGLFDTYKTRDGTPVAVPKSMSFGNMDNAVFENEILQPFIAFVCEHVIPNLDDEQLRAEVEDMVA